MQRYFLELTAAKGKVDGEASVEKFKGQIVVTGYSIGGHHTRSGVPGSREALAGAAVLEPFRLTKMPDVSSPELFRIWHSGEHVKTAVIHVCGTDADCTEMYTYTLTDVMIRKVSTTGQDAGQLAEVVELDFAKMKMEYKTPDGKKTVAVEIVVH